MPLSYPLDNNAYADSKLVEAKEYTDVNLAQSIQVLTVNEAYITKKDPFSYSNDIVTIKAGTTIPIFNVKWKLFVVNEDVDVSSLDTGSLAVGTDYYVYLLDNGTTASFIISANSIAPLGRTTSNSKKIGGFHYGHVRKVNSSYVPVDSNGVTFGATGTIWQNNVTIGIVPNSVWDLVNRPKCSPEGMVKIGDIWVDIYLASSDVAITWEPGGSNGLQHIANGVPQSKYGKLPLTGTEGLNWYSFAELSKRVGKKMLTYAKWISAAYGNPEGEQSADNYGWTKTTNSARAHTGCRVNNSTGVYEAGEIKPFAISAYNCVDCVGNVWEWLDELTIRQDSTSWGWQDVLGSTKGQAYLPNNLGLCAFISGGNWNAGSVSGSRSVHLHDRPWSVNTRIGSRFSCDNL